TQSYLQSPSTGKPDDFYMKTYFHLEDEKNLPIAPTSDMLMNCKVRYYEIYQALSKLLLDKKS
ncbi:MAG: hypothetical protein KAG53_01740, partial [Endozoicomonadaceae bacterium]|nr:hypothetical protein [Endozoicomonadaceae bacterium]